MKVATIGLHEPVADTSSVCGGFIAGEGNQLAVRRPDRSADDHIRIFLKGDLPSLVIGELLDPDVAVTAIVREVDHFAIVWTETWGLDLSGLVGDSNSLAHVGDWIWTGWKLPDVEFHALPTKNNSAVLIDVRRFIAGLAEGELLRVAPFNWHGPDMESRQVQQSASARSAVDDVISIRRPAEATHQRIVLGDLARIATSGGN